MAHQLGRLHVAIQAEDIGTAIAVRSRAETLARERFRVVLARVADELVPEAVDVRLDRLALDLGAIPPDRLEEDGSAAFEQALREALAAALADARGAPRRVARTLAPPEAAAEDLIAYLRRGAALPGFDLAARLSCAFEQPAALVSALHGLRGDRRAVERLVLQLGEAELRALLQLLAPADAALILRYHAELRGLYRATPAPPPDPVVRRVTWVLTFEYLLREAGSQFNRRAFVAQLLRGFAAELGIAYAELLARVREALAATRRRRPVNASLPAVLDALIAQQPGVPPPPEKRRRDAVAELVARLRAAAHDRVALAALLRGLSADLFAAAIRRIEPQHAATILRHLETLATIHADAPFVALPPDALLFQLRLITLRHLLHNAGTRFNRRNWMQRLLRGIAAVAGVAVGTLVEAVTVAVAELRRSRPIEGDFAVAMQDLVAAIPGARAGGGDADTIALIVARLRRRPRARAAAELAAGVSAETFAAVVRELAPARASELLAAIAALRDRHQRSPIVLASPDTLARALQQRTATWLAEHGDRSSVAQWRAHVAEVLGRQFGVPPETLHAAVAGDSADPRERRAGRASAAALQAHGMDAETLRANLAGRADRCRDLADQLNEAEWAATLALLTPYAGQVQADIAALERIYGERRLGSLRHPAVRALLRAAALAHLASTLHGSRAGWRSALLRGLALYHGWAVHVLGNWRQMVQPDAARPEAPTDSMRALEHYLRTGARTGRRAARAALVRADVLVLAAMMRRMAAARPARTDALAGRLLRLLPADEAIAMLRPDLTPAQAALLAFAWDAHPAGAQWKGLVMAMMQAGEAGAPVLPPKTMAALLTRWAGGDADLPGFLDPRAALLELDSAALVRLFSGADAERRLRRAVARLGGARGEALLRRLGEAVALPEAARDLDTIAARLAGRASAAPLLGEDAVFAAMLRWLEGEPDGAPSAAVRARWLALLRQAAASGDSRIDAALRRGLARPTARARWAELPDGALDAVLHRIAPARAALLLELRRLLAAAWRATVPARAGEGERLLSAAIFDLLARGEPSSIRAAAGALIAALRPDAGAERSLRSRAAWRARQTGQAHLAAAFTPPGPSPAEASRPTRTADPDDGVPVYVDNAGLVLFAPFLPALFERLGVLTQDGEGKPAITGIDALSRAVHLLQYCVDGRTDTPEPALALNKLLAGAALADPVAASIEASDEDRATCDGLVRGLIAHWSIISNTSPTGLRETFLNRPGRLDRGEHGWTLTVERRTVDVLVDQVPWSFSLILHGWMREPLHVTW